MIEFPKPLLKKTVWIELEYPLWEEIACLMEDKGITQEQVISTFVQSAYLEYKKQSVLTPPLDDKFYPESEAEYQFRIAKEAINTHNQVVSDRLQNRKPCKVCSQFKPLDEFYNDKKMLDGKSPHCKACWKAKYHHPAPYKVVITPPVVDTVQVTVEKPQLPDRISDYKKMINEKGAIEDVHVKNSVIDCALSSCERKFVKDMGRVYKGLEYCRDKCLEDFLNGGEPGGLGDLVAPSRELNLMEDQI